MALKRIDPNDYGITGFNGAKMRSECYVDIKAELPKPPIALSIGTTVESGEERHCEFGTYGNISFVHGASKSKKTFLKSLIVASYIGGKSNQYAPLIKTHRNKELYVLDFDTEQSKWHAQRVFKRAIRLVGADYSKYQPFYLRRYSWSERLEFIKWIVEQPPYKGKIGLISIDGFADLVKDVNDLDSCNRVVQELMTLSDVHNCHITGILHSNFGSEKPTGHLGSALLKKAETIALLEKCTEIGYENIVDVKFKQTRGYGIEDFSFMVDDKGLPIVTEGFKKPTKETFF